MKKYYSLLMVLSLSLMVPLYLIGQTHAFSDLVYGDDGNGGVTVIYQINGDVSSSSGGNSITINVTDGNGVPLSSGDVEVYRNTGARHNGRTRITDPTVPLDGNGQVVYFDGGILTSEPHFYSVKINGVNCQRSYPGIYLPNPPEDVVVETIGSSTITTTVYPNPDDFTAVLAVEYATDADFVALLESTGVIPIYPAGSQAVYYQEVMVDSDPNPSGRVNVNGSNFMFWGHEGTTFIKVTIPPEKVSDGGMSYAWYKSGRNRGNTATPIPINFGPQLPPLTGTLHSVEDIIYSGGTAIYNVSVDIGSNGPMHTIIFHITEPNGNPVETGNIDVYENDQARLTGRSQIANDLAISNGYVVYEHLGEVNTPVYFSIKVNNDRSSSRTYPAIGLPALQNTIVDASIPLTTRVYPLNDGLSTVILQLDITDDAAFQGLLTEPIMPAVGSQVHYSRVFSDLDDDPSGRVQIPGLVARWGSEGVTYIKTRLNDIDYNTLTKKTENVSTRSNDQTYYMWFKDGLNLGESTTPVPVTTDAVLPIELLSFDARAQQDGKVEVLWSTASEINHSHFVIECSEDGKAFNEVGKVDGEGGPYTVQQYTFMDEYPKYNLCYYRLKSVDLDGSLQFSDVERVHVRTSRLQMGVYPNPAQDELFVEGIESTAAVIIYNATGAIVKNLMTAGGRIGIEDLPNGIYFIDISSQGEKLTQKILVNR